MCEEREEALSFNPFFIRAVLLTLKAEAMKAGAEGDKFQSLLYQGSTSDW